MTYSIHSILPEICNAQNSNCTEILPVVFDILTGSVYPRKYDRKKHMNTKTKQDNYTCLKGYKW